MISDPVLRWTVTIAFAAAGSFCVYRVVRPGPDARRVDGGLHAALCAGMVAMAWPAAMRAERMPQVLLLGFAAVWLAGLLPVLDVRGRRENPGLRHHAVMAAAMMWMVLVMPARGAHTTMPVGHGTMAVTGAPSYVVLVAIVLTLAFTGAGVLGLTRAVRTVRAARLPAADLTADAVMALGMAVMVALLI